MIWLILGFSLSSGSGVLQSPLFDGFAFDLLPFQQDGLSSPDIDVGGRKIVQALMVSAVIVIADEVLDLPFKIARQVVVLEQYSILECLMPPLNLTLRLWMIGCATNVRDVVIP